MLIRRVSLALLICVAAVAGILVGLPASVPGAHEVEELKSAIPKDTGTPQATCGCGQTDSAVVSQEEGDTFEVSVPADALISDTATKLIYIGTPGPNVDAQDCAPDGSLRPMQTVIIVDPAGDSSRRIEGVVTISKNGDPFLTAVPNGTALGNFRDKSNCTVQGVPYFRYTATVLKGGSQ
jgi:hypothetical protein